MTTLNIAADGALPITLESIIGEKIAVLGVAGTGKALALDTPLPTPTGWTTMGEVAAGDWLLDEQGNPCRVTFATGIQLDRTCYEVVFSDGATIVADADHLWLSHTHKSRNADQRIAQKAKKSKGTGWFREKRRVNFPELVTTEQMRDTLLVTYNKTVKRNHAIPCTQPLVLPEAELPIAPYTFGAWLGDGTSAASSITTPDQEVLDEIRQEGYFVAEAYKGTQNGDCATYRIGNDRDGVPFHRALRLNNLLKNKHIPAVYLRGSYAQRLALLQGLMDTDGTVAKGSNSCIFTSILECLADAVAELVVSLGWPVYRTSRPAKLNGVQHGISREVRFRPTVNVFRLPRKGDLLDFDVQQVTRYLQRRVAAINPVPSVPVKCIQVDSPSHLYLAGRAMIPTHNTNSAAVIIEELLANHLPMTIVDIEGEYWGLKERYDVKVIGHSDNVDIEVDASQAAAFATYSVEQGVSLILDLSDYDAEQMQEFMVAYFTALWEAVFKARRPYEVVLEEAHEWIPQGVRAPLKEILGRFALRGRKRGVGMIIISQRSARVDKNVLTQSRYYFLHQVIHPTDLGVYKEILPLPPRQVDERVAALEKGIALVLANNEIVRVPIRLRHTYHAGATPQLDDDHRQTIQRADDSVLGDLRKLITHPDATEGDVATTEKVTEKANAEIERLRGELAKKEGTINAQRGEIGRLNGTIEKLQEEIKRLKAVALAPRTNPDPPAKRPALSPVPTPAPSRGTLERTSNTIQRQQRNWAAMLRDLQAMPRFQRDILTYLLEREGTAFTVRQLARGLTLAESTISNRPPLEMIRLGLIRRRGTPGLYSYEAGVREALAEKLPDMDAEALITEMLRRLK